MQSLKKTRRLDQQTNTHTRGYCQEEEGGSVSTVTEEDPQARRNDRHTHSRLTPRKGSMLKEEGSASTITEEDPQARHES